ncbi:hypothetical protein LIER_26187 [Lithospermum erythrorhizon]|uniref:Integrase catalytic domain-containing protein n=1 Tax=Lithospermum erythrorhizon TaxID=34254 RepID=A0AAV3R8S2_LITER
MIARRYTVTNGQRKQDLKHALSECKQTPTMSVANYFGKLEKLWHDLAACNPIPACICGMGEHLQRRLNEEKFHDFLLCLDATRFCHLRSELLVQDPTPSLDWAFQAMNQEEQLHKGNNIVKPMPEDVMTFAVTTQTKSNPEFKYRFLPNVTCTFCHRVGLDESTCFGKNGFPEWWGDRPQSRGRGEHGRGSNRGRGGLPPTRPQVAEARAVTCSCCGNASSSDGGRMDAIPGVSADQVKQLLSLLGSSTGVKYDDRLTEDTDCVVYCAKYGCLIQDPRSRMQIGLGERRGGLYYFKGDNGVWIFLMNDKTEVFSLFTRFMAIVERQFDGRVKTVRSDNGTDFFCLKQYFADRGIIFQTSCVGTPQQNGRVERKHRHILNVARALKFQANLPTEFWGDCVLTAGYLINWTPSQVLGFKTPYEYLFGTPPTLTELRLFGSMCYVHNLQAKSDKFSSRRRKCVFLGYPYGKKGWKVYDLETKECFVSRDV